MNAGIYKYLGPQALGHQQLENKPECPKKVLNTTSFLQAVSSQIATCLSETNNATGGTSACLIASRLADAAPSLNILILEAGPHTQDDLAHIQPARFLTHLQPDSKTVNFVASNPEPQLLGRSVVVPHGQCVGGGSSVNCEWCSFL